MERAVVIAVSGGALLYMLYLATTGESPRVVERVLSSIPAPISDPKMQPRVSGSASSLVQAAANSVMDPTIAGRVQALGGDAAATGAQQPSVSSKSLEVAPLSWDDAWCEGLNTEQCAELMRAYLKDVQG